MATDYAKLAAKHGGESAGGVEPPKARPVSDRRAIGMGFEATNPLMMALLRGGIDALPAAASFGGEVAGGALGGLAGLLGGPAAPVTVPAGAYAGAVGGAAGGGYTGQVGRNAIAGSPVGDFLGMTQPKSLTQGAGQQAKVGAISTAIGGPVANVAGRVGGVMSGKTLARASANAENIARSSKLKFNTGDVITKLRELKDEAAQMGMREYKALQRMEDNFLSTKGESLTAHELHRIRQIADNIAEKIQGRREAKLPVGPALAMKGRFWENLGNQARALLKDNVEGYAGAMGETRKAIASRERLPRVQEGPIRPTATNLMGLTEVVGRGLAGQPALQAYGNLLESPQFLGLLAQSPRLLSLFTSGQPDTMETEPPQ